MEAVKTHTQEQKDRAINLKDQVCELLNWSELQYAENQYNAGLQYLQHYIHRDPDGIDLLAANRIFWNWWKNRWLDRDEQFCNPGTPMLTPATRLKMYSLIHNPEFLAKEIYPNGIVLGASYALMIKDVIKSEVL